MNAPKQATLTASHGARRLSLMTAASLARARYFCKRTFWRPDTGINSGHAGRGAGLGVLDPTHSQEVKWFPAFGRAAGLEYAGKRGEHGAKWWQDRHADKPERKGRRCRNCASSR